MIGVYREKEKGTSIMARSIEEISKGKTTQDLRKEAVALLRKTKIPFVQQGIERTVI
jgi:hypothetical protein